VVAGVVRFVSRDVLQDAACVVRAVCASCLRGGGGRGAGHGCKGGAVRRAGPLAGFLLRRAYTDVFLSAWLRRSWRWTWWRGWCGVARGTAHQGRRVLRLGRGGGAQSGDASPDLARDDDIWLLRCSRFAGRGVSEGRFALEDGQASVVEQKGFGDAVMKDSDVAVVEKENAEDCTRLPAPCHAGTVKQRTRVVWREYDEQCRIMRQAVQA